MKKFIALFIVLTLCVSLFASCATPQEQTQPESSEQSETENADPVEITIWHTVDPTIAETLQKQTDSLAPEVVVTFERKENVNEALKLAGNDPSSAPDMYMWAHDKVGVFAAMGILSPITDILSEEELSDFFPMTLDAGTYKGERYQMPIYYEALLFMYNKALNDSPPETTEQLLEEMKERTTSDYYVLVEQHSTAYSAAPWIQGFGGYIINSDMEPGLNLPETIEALEYHKEFVPYMPADGEYNTVTTLFTEGKAEFTIGGPWLVPGLKEANIDLGIAPMPVLPNGSPLMPFSGVQGVQVLKHAAENKKEAVAETLKVLASPEAGIELAKAANCAPANAMAYEDPAVTENEMIMALEEMAAKVVPMPNIPEMDVMWGVTDGLLASVNKNGGDVATEAEKYQQQAIEQIEAMQ